MLKRRAIRIHAVVNQLGSVKGCSRESRSEVPSGQVPSGRDMACSVMVAVTWQCGWVMCVV